MRRRRLAPKLLVKTARSGAPAHKVARLNDFTGLAALLRNFFAPRLSSAARRGADGRGLGTAIVIARSGPGPFRSSAEEPQKRRKRNDMFRQRNQRFRDGGRKPLISLSAKSGDFAGLFVFNDLNALLFHTIRAAPLWAESPSRAQRVARRLRPDTLDRMGGVPENVNRFISFLVFTASEAAPPKRPRGSPGCDRRRLSDRLRTLWSRRRRHSRRLSPEVGRFPARPRRRPRS